MVNDKPDISNGKLTPERVGTLAKKQRNISKRGLSQQYENTESTWSFYNADQMNYNDRIQFADTWGRRRRAMVNFNKVQQNVDSVVGFMAQNRRQAKFIAHLPRDQKQELYSKNMNAIYDYHRENENADQTETEQDLDMMVNGYGATDAELTYIVGMSTTMPNGEVSKKKLDPSCTYWDPSANDKNLLSARWMGYWDDYELKDAIALFQDSTEEDFEQVGEEDPSDTGYVFNPYGGIYDKIKMSDTVEWASKDQNMVRVYNHQWFEYETFYKAENPLYTTNDPLDAMFIKMKLDEIQAGIKTVGDVESKDMFAFNPKKEVLVFDEATKRQLVKIFGKTIDPIPFKRKVFYTAVVSGTHVFTWFKSVCQQGFSIKFKTGTWNRTAKVWQGMVNGMMEPAKYYNKALTELMFTIASNSKGGVMVEKSAVEDIADFEGKWAKTDAVIEVNDGALMSGKIQEKVKGAVPTGLENILTLADQNISANGVPDAFMGEIGREDQSGILYKRLIKQILSKFARYVDSITLYQKEDARLHADLIPIWVENNQGEWMRITGPDGAEEFVQIMNEMLAPEYDVTIQEASQSSDEKLETSAMLSGLADKLFSVGDMESGKALVVEAIQDMRLDGDRKNRIAQILQPKQQVDPQAFAAMQQQLQELQQIIQSGQVEKTQSETQKNLATAAKTMKDAQLAEATLPKIAAEIDEKMANARKADVESYMAATSDQVSVTV